MVKDAALTHKAVHIATKAWRCEEMHTGSDPEPFPSSVPPAPPGVDCGDASDVPRPSTASS